MGIGGRLRSAASGSAGRVSGGVLDQLLSSGSNFLALLVAARLLTTSYFGIYALAATTYLMALGACRALCSEALLVRIGDDAEAAAERSGRAVADAMVLGILAGVVLAVAAPFTGTGRGTFLALAVTLPLLLAQDTFRYAALARRRPMLALRSDLLWLLLQIPAYALVIAGGDRIPSKVFLAWAGAGAAAGAVQLVVDRVPVRPTVRLTWLRENLDLGGRYGIDFLAGAGAAQVASYALAAIAGVTALGALRGAQTIFGPMNVLISGAYIAFVPEAHRLARSSTSALTRLCVALGILLALGAAVLTAVLLALPDAQGRLLLDDSWAEASSLILPVGLASMAGGVFAGASTGIRALEGARNLLRARVFTVPFTLLVPIVGAWRYGLTGAAYGITIAAWWSLIWWWRAYAQSARAHRTRTATNSSTT